jgi:hypothetical protein
MINITPLCDFGEMCTGEIVGSQNGRSFCVAHDPTGLSPALEAAKERVAKTEAALRSELAKPSEPSDERKPRVADAPIQWTDGSGTWFKLFTRTWTERDQRRTDPVAATPADILAAGFVPLSQLQSARFLMAQVATMLEAEGRDSTHSEAEYRETAECLAADMLRRGAAPPSPPAAVEAKSDANSCCACGAQASRVCDDDTSSFICGFRLCDDCEHYTNERGFGAHRKRVEAKPAEGSEVDAAGLSEDDYLRMALTPTEDEAPAQEQPASPKPDYITRAELASLFNALGADGVAEHCRTGTFGPAGGGK